MAGRRLIGLKGGVLLTSLLCIMSSCKAAVLKHIIAIITHSFIVLLF